MISFQLFSIIFFILARETFEDTWFHVRAPSIKSNDFVLLDIIECPNGTFDCLLGLDEKSSTVNGEIIPALSVFVMNRTFEQLYGDSWDSDSTIRITKGAEELGEGRFRIRYPRQLNAAGTMTFHDTIFESGLSEPYMKFGVKNIHNGQEAILPAQMSPNLLSEYNYMIIRAENPLDETDPYFNLGMFTEDGLFRVLQMKWPNTETPVNVVGLSDGGHYALLDIHERELRVLIVDNEFGSSFEINSPKCLVDISKLGVSVGFSKAPEQVYREYRTSQADKISMPCYWNQRGEVGYFSGEGSERVELELACVETLRVGNEILPDHAIVGAKKNSRGRSEAILAVCNDDEIVQHKTLQYSDLSFRTIGAGDARIVDALKVTPRGVILGLADSGSGAAPQRVVLLPEVRNRP